MHKDKPKDSINSSWRVHFNNQILKHRKETAMFFWRILHAKLGRNLGFFTSAQCADLIIIYSINELVTSFSTLLMWSWNLR